MSADSKVAVMRHEDAPAEKHTPQSQTLTSPSQPEKPNEQEQGVPGRNENQEMSDLELAMMMQEQERAHFLLAGGAYGAGSPMAQNLEYASDVPGEQAYDPEDATDEAIAWRLMQEEQQQFNQRLMAMAGHFGAHPESPGADEDEAEAMDTPDVEGMTYEGLLALGDPTILLGSIFCGTRYISPAPFLAVA
mmetsp:Transcript_13037/g.36671  ORF Transcript_13037/g.36671 Transcript_13037/m.36671 type:complete len:191 (+) Transcript_13037:324-896(+)